MARKVETTLAPVQQRLVRNTVVFRDVDQAHLLEVLDCPYLAQERHRGWSVTKLGQADAIVPSGAQPVLSNGLSHLVVTTDVLADRVLAEAEDVGVVSNGETGHRQPDFELVLDLGWAATPSRWLFQHSASVSNWPKPTKPEMPETSMHRHQASDHLGFS